jgi:hypothetical protein
MEREVRTWCSEAGVEQFLTASNRSDIDIAQDVGSAISRILARLDTKKLSPEDKKHHKKIRFAVYQVLVDRYNEGLRSAFRCRYSQSSWSKEPFQATDLRIGPDLWPLVSLLLPKITSRHRRRAQILELAPSVHMPRLTVPCQCGVKTLASDAVPASVAQATKRPNQRATRRQSFQCNGLT